MWDLHAMCRRHGKPTAPPPRLVGAGGASVASSCAGCTSTTRCPLGWHASAPAPRGAAPGRLALSMSAMS
eukprot:8601771-Alexandrium_andersonii.AAC.1